MAKTYAVFLPLPPSSSSSLSNLSSAFWCERFSAGFSATSGPFALEIRIVLSQRLAVVRDLSGRYASDVNSTGYVASGSPFAFRPSSHKESLPLLQIRHNDPNN